MMVAPVPINEKERLAKVAEWCVMHQQHSGELAALVDMARSFFAVPVCLVSIVGECQQWFSAKAGLDLQATPRDVSFCAHTILQAQPLEVLDATCDPRFADNPLVTGEPGIRYYCGAPLLVENRIAIGSFCIIDTVPRPPLDQAQRTMLMAFGEMAMQIIAGMRRNNFHDQATGLFNRLKLECDVAAGLERGQPLTLLAVDIMSAEALSGIIRSLGYNFAHDLTLQAKARIASQLDNGLCLYKISPTRFAVLLEDAENVLPLCQRIVAALQAPAQCHQIPVLLDAGIGIAPISPQGEDRNSLEWMRRAVAAADTARRTAGRHAWYQPEVDAAQRRAFMLLASLSRALHSDDELSLHLQPRIELPSGRCRSAEALLRWQHPVLGEVSPAEFIPLAEKTALMANLSLWVMRAVLRILGCTRGLDFSVSFNVTARDLESAGFMDALLHALQEQAVEPQRVQLELTESVLIEQPEEVQQQLLRARQAGIVIAIDDFGTGYSNWAYLTQIPASIVKLDKSLVHRASSGGREALLVQSLAGLANELGYRVAAEGIETAEQLVRVCAWGCVEAQGYFIARPMPAAAFRAWFDDTQLAGSVA
ncbi:sensor domain-containing phosphodiesterase [Pseudomonas sp. AFG_SD02_1510_Pfu_092]|uniref:sensor domain-containing phosphodiesterase n=1 Tax=Pseudomonas sp. AFG_SD02_1510_Pfu_092 TaxID=2259497 RepID=UPI000DEF731F|nr:GGDEF and EAL domain-containing protein [Pseudomonas sp. AFG_SD02_1510_Pfu_092]RCL28832.1 sensor domain-containing phosphodiesterase [Pseudomonas sp. AFG_SD02_1510_Pfu_092]